MNKNENCSHKACKTTVLNVKYANFLHLRLQICFNRFVSVIRCLSQLDNDNAGYAEKLLQATTVGKYCEKLVGIIQVI